MWHVSCFFLLSTWPISQDALGLAGHFVCMGSSSSLKLGSSLPGSKKDLRAFLCHLLNKRKISNKNRFLKYLVDINLGSVEMLGEEHEKGSFRTLSSHG